MRIRKLEISGFKSFVDRTVIHFDSDVIGIVEIMKNFHQVESDQTGILDHFLVENDDVVEAGQEIAVLR